MGSPSPGERVLQPGRAIGKVREVRARIQRRLALVAGEIGALAGLPEGERRPCMERVIREMEACLRPHLAWEERTIHPVVDRYACEGPAMFSSSMRYEHEIIYRWLAELKDLAEGEATPFARRADNLLGVVEAHFELEEHVLFPILVRGLGSAALRERVGDPNGP